MLHFWRRVTHQNRILAIRAVSTRCPNAFLSTLFLLRGVFWFWFWFLMSLIIQCQNNDHWRKLSLRWGMRGERVAEPAPCTRLPWKASYKMRSFRNFPLKCFQFLNCLLLGKWIASWLKKKDRQLGEGGGWASGRASGFLQWSQNGEETEWFPAAWWVPRDVSTQRCQPSGHSHEKASSPPPAVNQILGYKIASLNPRDQRGPVELCAK